MPRQPGGPKDLAVVLFDLAWLLPRTLDQPRDDAIPPTELEIMKLLVRRPGLSVTEVAKELGLQPSNVSTAVRSLAERGLVDRRPHSRDARVGELHPTRAARANRRAREEAWGRAMEARLAELPPAEAQRLRESAASLRALADVLARS